MFTFSLNWLAILGAGVIAMVAGFIWYSKPLFATSWMKYSGLKQQDMKPNPVLFLFTFLAALVAAYILANLVKNFAAGSFVSGMGIGFVASLLPFTALLSTFLFERKPFQLLLIDGLYHVVWMTVAGGLLALWV
jgi:hypothetical protein